MLFGCGSVEICTTDERPSMVAVVVPCNNAEATLGATLESVLAQDGIQEIVAIDDGSTDMTLSVARSFEPCVRVFTGPNQGVSAARNRGIAETTSEWLLFLDADDILMQGTLANRLKALKGTAADVIICDWEDMIGDGGGTLFSAQRRSIDWLALQRDAEIAIATHVWATTAAVLYHRSLVQRIGGFRTDLPVIQDARFLFDAAYHGARFAHAPHLGARYRILSNSLSRRNKAGFWQDVLLNGQQIEALWHASGTMSEERRGAISGIYNNAARGLFAAAHPRYFEAVEAQRKLGLPRPRHSRFATPLARVVGLRAARAMLSLGQRA